MADIEISVDSGTSKRLNTAGKYCDKDIVVTAKKGVVQPVIEPLEVTSNGTYNAPAGVDGYSPVTVNVSGGGETVQVILTLNDVPIYSFWYTEKGELKNTKTSGNYTVDKNSIIFIYQGPNTVTASGDIYEIYNYGDTKNVFFVSGNSELNVGGSGGSIDRISDTEALNIITGGATE